MSTCDVPECNQPAVLLLANDEPLTSSEYAEREVCRWHARNPWPHPDTTTHDSAEAQEASNE